jgi:DNA polymerase elongation subunit (family B)
MKEEEIEKMLKELEEIRKSYRSKTLTAVRPTGSTSMISNGVVSMDFASLYPSTMTMKFPSKQSRRMKKIKNIFQ